MRLLDLRLITSGMASKRGSVALLLVAILFIPFGPSYVFAEDLDGKPFKLTMNKNKTLCSYVLDVLNEDVEKYGHGYNDRKFRDKVFTVISWTVQGSECNYYGQVARFDIDNNGKPDVIVRQATGGVRDITFDQLFVFKEAEYPEAAKKVVGLEERAAGAVVFDEYEFRGLPEKTLHGGPELEGTKYYEGLTSATHIYPLIFEGKIYLLLKTSPDIILHGHDRAVVAKYKGAKCARLIPH